jgi:hypothetical protein
MKAARTQRRNTTGRGQEHNVSPCTQQSQAPVHVDMRCNEHAVELHQRKCRIETCCLDAGCEFFHVFLDDHQRLVHNNFDTVLSVLESTFRRIVDVVCRLVANGRFHSMSRSGRRLKNGSQTSVSKSRICGPPTLYSTDVQLWSLARFHRRSVVVLGQEVRRLEDSHLLRRS